MIHLTDSHAHLNFSAFNDDRDEVIKRCEQKQMKVINVGSQLATSVSAVELAQKHNNMFAAISIHPIHIGQYDKDPLESGDHKEFERIDIEGVFTKIVHLADEEKVVAIGETGLDYFRIQGDVGETKKLQRQYFERFLDLAEEKNLPVILHCRDANTPSQPPPYQGRGDRSAYEEMLEILTGRKLRGVIHCFGSTPEIAKKFVDLGYLIGFTGIITFGKKTEKVQEAVKQTPMNKILIETDCPYLAPEPYRGKRNEPIYVEFIAKKVAELKGLSVNEVVEATGKNAEKLFKI